MKYIITIILVITFLSCNNDKKTKILIENNTNSTIDSLKLTYGTEKESTVYLEKNINPKEKVKVIFDMNFKGVDGGYFLEVYKKEKKKKIEKYFGYYSNAVFKNYTYFLKIENDTLLINKELLNWIFLIL